MKRITSIILAVCLLITMTSYSAISVSAQDIQVEYISILGEKMNIGDYRDVYGKPINERVEKQHTPSYQSKSLIIHSIDITAEQIELDYQIDGYREAINGVLYNSQRNMNNIVAVFDCTGEYDVLFFEITKGNEQINLLYNTALNNNPHMKIYMRDDYDAIYLFESELPTELSAVSVASSEYCDIYNDYLWYVNIVDSYVTTTNETTMASILVNENDPNAIVRRNIAIASGNPNESMTTLATTTPTDPMIWGGKKIYEMSVSNGVDQTTYMFYPYGYIRGTPVSVNSENTWWGSVEVSEHTATKMIGSSSEPTVTYGINRFSIRNPEIAAVCGNYTLVVRTFVQGRIKRNSNHAIVENGDEIAARILKKAFSYVPYGKTATEILSWLSSITQTVQSEVTLGANGIDLSSGCVSGTKFELDSKYNLTKYTEASNGHSLKMHVVVSRTQSTTDMTTGAVRINYDVYTNVYDYHDSHQAEKSFLYSDSDYDNGNRDYYYYW